MEERESVNDGVLATDENPNDVGVRVLETVIDSFRVGEFVDCYVSHEYYKINNERGL